jgi:pilus assembly protein CpaF
MSFELILPFLRPIESLLLDDTISEIMGNPDSSWWYERDGIVRREASVSFDAGRLRTGLEVIANQLGKKLDEDNPVLHAQLPDGSRLAAVIPPVVLPAPALTIRKFTSRHYTVDDLIARGTLTRPIADFLAEEIAAGKTLLISGGTSTGKTTLLRVLADAIPADQRIVVIEDTAELHIQKPNILAVECQSDTFKASITFDDLLKSALRWRPDRIILGEVRGIEARTLLDSLNTGHAGSLATIHANSAEKALRRFAHLVLRNHMQTTFADIEAEIADAVDYVVHVDRQPGRRTIREVLALHGYDRETKRFLMEPVFVAQLPTSVSQCHLQRSPEMPLLEVSQSRQISASIRLEETTARQVDQYAAFIHAGADDVVEQALNYVFTKDRDFQEFLKSSEARQVPATLRVRKAPVSEAVTEVPRPKPSAVANSSESMRLQKA